MNKNKKLWALFAIYSIVMLWLLFGQRIGFVSYDRYLEQLSQRINLIPFKTVAEYVEMYKTSALSLVNHAIRNLGGNVILFIPIGIFLPAIWPKLNRTVLMLIASSALIASVEIIQYFTLLGSLDIDDFILNIAGIFLGFLIHKSFIKLRK